ncbi:MAG: hypothetical protein M3N16_07550 [Actinomycetota bacterium]|nr:hypothetical protein [Actinomycetota bacterium]
MESPDRRLGEEGEPAPGQGDRRAAEEAEAAAAEAGAIGGRVDEAADLDPADRPVIEAGGGQAEGFEQAEDQLIERASHGDPPGDPLADAGGPEPEAQRSTAAYGDADEVEATELVRDPDAGPDDPGAGPGIARDR